MTDQQTQGNLLGGNGTKNKESQTLSWVCFEWRYEPYLKPLQEAKSRRQETSASDEAMQEARLVHPPHRGNKEARPNRVPGALEPTSLTPSISSGGPCRSSGDMRPRTALPCVACCTVFVWRRIVVHQIAWHGLAWCAAMCPWQAKRQFMTRIPKCKSLPRPCASINNDTSLAF